MNDALHYHTKTSTTFSLHVENNTLPRTSSSRKYYYPLAIAFDDTSIASIFLSIHHHHRAVSLHLQVARSVVASTATVAEANVLVELVAKTATTVVAVAVASVSVAVSNFVPEDWSFVTASNLVFAISVVKPVVA
ncbi:hypothetical protein HanXRQr2_Chr05g0210411 [Helianthus annuus]|uniref:Uncharacterized protein n=1 Tax=Helianthus annuus TaxID=4232 RepID=A0A9K3IYR7_HELAN|nr:hypothetical protein HanXRQr2_Chr05g0210411 [Helianthus annuus]